MFKKYPKLLELIRSRKNDADIFILITHYEYSDFPKYFAKEELGKKIPYFGLENGEALVINCDQKIYTHIKQWNFKIKESTG
jgi:hypothetical protein